MKKSGAFDISGCGPDVEGKVLDQPSVNKDIDSIFTDAPFIVWFAGKIDAILAVFSREATRHNLRIGLDAGNVDSDEVHFYDHRLSGVKPHDAVYRNVGREKAGNRVAGLAVAVVLGEKGLFDRHVRCNDRRSRRIGFLGEGRGGKCQAKNK